MEKTFTIVIGNHKCVIISGNMLDQEAINLYILIKKRPDMNNTKPSTQARGDFTDSGIGLD